MKKKLLVLVLAICIVFTACSKKQDNKKNTPNRIGTEDVFSGIIEGKFTFDEALKKADLVAEVEITEWLCESDQIATYYSAEIIKIFGDVQGIGVTNIGIIQDGNSISTLKGYPLFANGDRLFLFLNKVSEEDRYEDLDTYYILGAHTLLMQIREINGREYAIKFVDKFDEFDYIEADKNNKLVSNDLMTVEIELLNELLLNSVSDFFDDGKYNPIENRQVLDLEMLYNEIEKKYSLIFTQCCTRFRNSLRCTN